MLYIYELNKHFFNKESVLAWCVHRHLTLSEIRNRSVVFIIKPCEHIRSKDLHPSASSMMVSD